MPQKTLVVRLGAIGDLVFITPVLQALKHRGDEVGVVCKPHGRAVFHGAGLVDRLHIWSSADEEWVVAQDGRMDRLAAAQERVEAVYARDYDQVIHLDGVIENNLLWPTRRRETVRKNGEGVWWRWVEDHGPWERGERPFRHDNYYELMLAAAGLSGRAAPEPVWRVLPKERRWAGKFKKKHGLAGRPLVVIQLAGSGPNKAWPYWPAFCMALLRAAPQARLVSLGVFADQVLEWDWVEQDPRIIGLASRQTVRGEGWHVAWDRLRREAALIEAADLFVGPDSSILHCVGSLPTFKVALMSICHHDNVLKHYRNCVGLQSAAPCSPCGKLTVDCHRGPLTGGILCMEQLAPGRVLTAALDGLKRAGALEG